MCIDYPAPALWANGTIAPGETRCTELVSDDSQYFMESLPFSSPDEFPTPRNLSACFFDLNDRQAHGQYRKCLARHRDDMRLANFQSVRGLDPKWKLLRCPIEYCLPNLTPLWANRNLGANRSEVGGTF